MTKFKRVNLVNSIDHIIDSQCKKEPIKRIKIIQLNKLNKKHKTLYYN